MDRNHYTAYKNCERTGDCKRAPVPEPAGFGIARDNPETLPEKSDLLPSKRDAIQYLGFGPLTRSGIYPATTEYQHGYNRGPLAPMRTTLPRSWTYKPYWSTASMLQTANLRDFPMPDRLRFNLDDKTFNHVPPIMATQPRDLKTVENLMLARQEANVPEWTIRDPYRVGLVDQLNRSPSGGAGGCVTSLKKNALRACQEENQIIANKESAVKQKLGERINDTNYWRREIVAETHLLEKEMREIDSKRIKLELEIKELEGPLRVSLGNTDIRRVKKSENAVIYLDNIDDELSKEQEMINNARESYKTMVAALLAQNGTNRVMLDDLYSDSAKKHTALNIDRMCYGFNHTSPEVRSFPASETKENTVSTQESWATNCEALIRRSAETRNQSNRLRQEADKLLKEVSYKLWTQWTNVNEKFGVKIAQLEEQSRQLHHRHMIVSKELADLMRDADLLKNNIAEKIKPLNLAQTRLQWRANRIDMENCHDNAHKELKNELTEVHGAISRLQAQLKEVETNINALNFTKNTLQHEINSTSDAIHRDKEKCLAKRKGFPVSFRDSTRS